VDAGAPGWAMAQAGPTPTTICRMRWPTPAPRQSRPRFTWRRAFTSRPRCAAPGWHWRQRGNISAYQQRSAEGRIRGFGGPDQTPEILSRMRQSSVVISAPWRTFQTIVIMSFRVVITRFWKVSPFGRKRQRVISRRYGIGGGLYNDNCRLVVANCTFERTQLSMAARFSIPAGLLPCMNQYLWPTLRFRRRSC